MGSRNNKPGRIVKGTALQPSLKSASGVWSLDEAMQAHRANAWPQPNLFQPISNSLRFKNNVSYVTRQVVRQGNQRTFTVSLWVKRDSIGTRDALFNTCNVSGTAYWGVEFGSDDYLYVYDNFSSTLTTTQVFRDTGAWYHIVVAVDTLQATDSNRTKVYVNGTRVTSFSAAGYPAQGLATRMNGIDVPNQAIGCWFPSIGAFQYGGYITEVNFIDGHALDPSLLGKFDTNNTWVPVPYTGSYGTNGFYLPFTNTTTSQTLGYDASLNGTTTYDVDQDPYRGSVALHLTGNGPAGGNNNTFADSSPNNLAITRGGIATQGSFSPFPMQANTPYNPATHGASAYFGGSSNNDYLSLASNAITALPGDFTLEAWVYPTSVPNTYLGIAVATVTDGIWFGHLATGLGLRRYGTGDVIQSSTAPIANVWTHVAVTRSGSTNRLFINGVLNTTVTDSTSYVQGALVIGSDGAPGSVPQRWPGYISNLRITKGVAIYTAAFTPTNRPFGTLTNNLLTFSEDFNNAYWTQGSVTVTPSAAVAPDGNPSATKLTASSTGSIAPQIYKYPNPNLSNSTTYTLSVYAKAAEYNYIVLNNNDGLGSYRTWFNLTTGTVGTNASGNTASMVSVGNGWYRCIVYRTMAASSAANSLQGIQISNADTADTFSATAGSGIYIWGAQIEQGTSATNYTPTPANFSTAPSLLLNFANAAVVDSAGTNIALTGGNATISSASKYGSGAMTFTADGYLSFAPGAQYAFGTGDFTIEAWVRTTETTGDTFYRRIYMTDGPTGNASGNIQLAIAPSTGYANLWDGGGLDMLSTTNISTGAWFHIAATRVGTTLRLFVNGKQESISSYNTSIAPNSGTPRPWVGAYTSSSGRWNGQIDDLRVTKGVARYTTDFAPPARALPETGGKSFVTSNINAGVAQRFTTTGTTAWTAPTDVTSVEVLVVAGGGGGGAFCGGGGGAGGLIYNNSYPVTPGQSYTVTVGAGGVASGASASRGTNGSNSVFGNLTAIGGGGGASLSAQGGLTGGSGGGDSHTGQTAGAGTAGQGFAGGRATPSAYDEAGGGGGGAGAVGFTGVGSGTTSATVAGIGGPGLAFGISGSSTFYAGGGAGGVMRGSARQLGGAGGGGNGAGNGTNATSATVNTGGGGGGGGRADLSPPASYTGGDGGSGIVIVRYTTTAVGNTSDATSDNLVDSPTQYGHDMGLGGEVVGNYCTLNPIDTETDHSFSNGNLTLFKAAGNWSSVRSTMAFSSGKWYFETTYNASWDYAHMGVLDVTVDTYAGQVANSGYVGNYAKGWAYQQDARIYNNNTILSGSGVQVSLAGDIAMCAVDMDNGKIWWGKNGTWFNSGNPAAGTNAAYSNLSGTVSPAFSVYGNSSGITVNFGQRAWAYAPPAGFNALTTKNLPRLAIGSAAAAPNEYFDAVTWTGTGAAQTITLPGAFQPDLVWTKSRSFENNHHLFDSVRGSTVSLKSNTTAAEDVRSTTLQAFNSNGFSLGSAADVNGSGSTYVAWCWRAGGAAVSNTSGTLTSQVSANTASGFSVVTYTGTATSGATVGHGLSAAPELIITKARNQTDGWYTYTTVIDGTMDYFQLNTDAGKGNSGLAVPTSTVFYNDGWSASYNMLAYCFHSVAGYSKIGTYVGNGSADGPFIYTGFKPRFVMVKCSSTAGFRWIIWDTARDPVNFATRGLSPNLAGAEVTAFDADILSNGFKLRDLEGTLNTSGDTYIYMAIADKPFGNVNGVAR